MKQQVELKRCLIQGMKHEREAVMITISNRQRKHKTVAKLQERLKELTHQLLAMEAGK